MASLTDVPPILKPILGVLLTASNHEKIDPVITYWCRLHAMQQALKIDSKSKESRAFLVNVMSWLEEFKKSHKDNETVTNEVVAQAHLENYAMKLFDRADREDRDGAATKNTSKIFFTSSQIFDCLSVFADSSVEAAQRSKYAKWRAAYINKCLKNGDTPLPPSQDDEITLDVNYNPEAPTDQPSVPAAGPSVPSLPSGSSTSSNQTFSRPILGETPTLPSSAPIPSPTTNLAAQNGAPLNPQLLIKAEKFCKWAGSSLQYEDVPTAISNLEKALTLLKTGEDVN